MGSDNNNNNEILHNILFISTLRRTDLVAPIRLKKNVSKLCSYIQNETSNLHNNTATEVGFQGASNLISITIDRLVVAAVRLSGGRPLVVGNVEVPVQCSEARNHNGSSIVDCSIYRGNYIN